jgi:hypothetical protein
MYVVGKHFLGLRQLHYCLWLLSHDTVKCRQFCILFNFYSSFDFFEEIPKQRSCGLL